MHAPDGLLRLAPNLGWRDVDVAGLLSREPSLAGLAGHGASSWTTRPTSPPSASWRRAATPGRQGSRSSFLYVSGEIGVGAGIVLDGRIFRGGHGWGGEIGHLPVDPDGPPCRCGSRGCLEQYAGREAVLRAADLPSVRRARHRSRRRAAARGSTR